MVASKVPRTNDTPGRSLIWILSGPDWATDSTLEIHRPRNPGSHSLVQQVCEFWTSVFLPSNWSICSFGTAGGMRRMVLREQSLDDFSFPVLRDEEGTIFDFVG